MTVRAVDRGRAKPRCLLRRPDVQAAARLFCLPYSGSGASSYHRWPRHVGSIEICPVQLPGRENRMREPLCTTYEEIAQGLVEGLAPHLDRPFALFGHCGAALAAFETALRLSQAPGPDPACLFVSSEVAPHEGPYGRFLTMDEEGLVNELNKLIRELGGEPMPGFLEMGLRVLDADLEANKRYRLERPVPLGCPISAIGWSGDHEVPADLMQGWSAYGTTTSHLLDGAHYDFLQAPPELLSVLMADLSAAAGVDLDTTR